MGRRQRHSEKQDPFWQVLGHFLSRLLLQRQFANWAIWHICQCQCIVISVLFNHVGVQTKVQQLQRQRRAVHGQEAPIQEVTVTPGRRKHSKLVQERLTKISFLFSFRTFVPPVEATEPCKTCLCQPSQAGGSRSRPTLRRRRHRQPPSDRRPRTPRTHTT